MLWFDLLLSLLVVIGDHVYFLQLICRSNSVSSFSTFLHQIESIDIHIVCIISTWYQSTGNHYSGEEIDFVLNNIQICSYFC